MNRLDVLALALLYLLPQAGIWAHVEDDAAVCGDCGPASGPAFECSGLDCDDPGHHHHSTHHHPGTCRVCSSGVLAAVESVSIDDVSCATLCLFIDPAHPAAQPADPARAIRAPPGTSPGPG